MVFVGGSKSENTIEPYDIVCFGRRAAVGGSVVFKTNGDEEPASVGRRRNSDGEVREWRSRCWPGTEVDS